MPPKTLRPCTHPGCGALTTTSRCAAHEYADHSGPPHPFYATRTWKQIRADKLRRNPLCEPCLALGVVHAANMVHHRDRNPLNNDPSNLESMRMSCHSAHTAAHDGGFGNRIKAEQGGKAR